MSTLQVKCGDDINFIFRSELPKLLSQPPFQVPALYKTDCDVLRLASSLHSPKHMNPLIKCVCCAYKLCSMYCTMVLVHQPRERDVLCFLCLLCTGRFLPVNEVKVKKALPWVGDRRMVGLSMLLDCVMCFEVLDHPRVFGCTCICTAWVRMRFVFNCHIYSNLHMVWTGIMVHDDRTLSVSLSTCSRCFFCLFSLRLSCYI